MCNYARESSWDWLCDYPGGCIYQFGALCLDHSIANPETRIASVDDIEIGQQVKILNGETKCVGRVKSCRMEHGILFIELE